MLELLVHTINILVLSIFVLNSKPYMDMNTIHYYGIPITCGFLILEFEPVISTASRSSACVFCWYLTCPLNFR